MQGPKSPENFWETMRTGKNQITLTDQVRMWPTPQERDFRSGEGHRWMVPEERSRNLTDAVAFSRDYKMTPESLPHPGGGQLNPTWVESLMGFPVGWTDISDEG